MLDKLCRDPSHLERQLKVKLAEEKDLKIFDWLKLVSKFIQYLLCTIFYMLKFICIFISVFISNRTTFKMQRNGKKMCDG